MGPVYDTLCFEGLPEGEVGAKGWESWVLKWLLFISPSAAVPLSQHPEDAAAPCLLPRAASAPLGALWFLLLHPTTCKIKLANSI